MVDFLYIPLDINWHKSREAFSIFFVIFIVRCLIEELSSRIRSLRDQKQQLQGSIARTRNDAATRLSDTINNFNNTRSDTGSLLKCLILRSNEAQMDERFIDAVTEALNEQNKLDDEFTKHIHKDPHLVDTSQFEHAVDRAVKAYENILEKESSHFLRFSNK